VKAHPGVMKQLLAFESFENWKFCGGLPQFIGTKCNPCRNYAEKAQRKSAPHADAKTNKSSN
jgi:hypothetical protein